MRLQDILAEIDAEIARLEQAKQLLTGTAIKRRPGRPSLKKDVGTPPKKRARRMSADVRARIAAAQKARWAKIKKTAKEPASQKGATAK